MIAKKQAKKGTATSPNSTTVLPVSLSSKRLAIGRKRRPSLASGVPMKTSCSVACRGQKRRYILSPRRLDEGLRRRSRPGGRRSELVNHVGRDGALYFAAPVPADWPLRVPI